MRELRENPPVPHEYLTPREAAQFVKLTPRALEQMRGQKRGPRFHKVGRLCRYKLDDLRSWIEGGAEA